MLRGNEDIRVQACELPRDRRLARWRTTREMPTHRMVVTVLAVAFASTSTLQPAISAAVVDASASGISGLGNRCTIRGTPGNDRLRGTFRADVICGFGGRDRLIGLGGDDVIRGAQGRDEIIGSTGSDRLKGGAHGDLVRGSSGGDRIWGNSGNDELRGGIGNDDLDAVDGDGGDLVRGQRGTDTCTADAGDTTGGCEHGDAAKPPAAPSGLDAIATAARVDLTWNASARAAGYKVFRDGTRLATVTRRAYSDGTVQPDTTYSYRVRAFNDGGASAPSQPLQITTDPAASQTFVVMAAGDIACDPASASFNSGDGTANRCRHKHTARLLSGADHVLTLGDQQYECGGLSAFNQSYDPSWGDFKGITHPILADEEYGSSGTGCGAAGPDGYLTYFADQLEPHQASASDPNRGYYSFDIGSWHVIALNSECSRIPGGCGQGGAQNDWLESDLAASTASCTIALMHEPRFASKANGGGPIATLKPFWEDLYAHGVEIVLSGDQHFYERYSPQDPDGNADPNGTVQWVVGTGGKSHGGLAPIGSRRPNSVTAVSSTYGVLRLVLRDDTYDWRFLVEGSSPYADSGTASCR